MANTNNTLESNIRPHVTDSVESSSEFLIQHLPLASVLAYVVARDDVRQFVAADDAPSSFFDGGDGATETASTVPAPAGRVLDVYEADAPDTERSAAA